MMTPEPDKERAERQSFSKSSQFKFAAFFIVAVILLFYVDLFEISSSNSTGFGKGSVEKRSNSTVAVPLPNNVRSESHPKKGGVKNMPDPAPRHVFHRRGKPISDEVRASIIEKWGTWTWEDETPRPTVDFYKDFPNRDVPWSQFPAGSWQKNPEYVSRFLKESLGLVTRGMEAILSEYGHGKQEMSDQSFDERKVMFNITFWEDEAFKNATELPRLAKDLAGTEGGMSTHRSWEGLKRRLLHSLMTEDTFIFAMGGHSAAAGHGNHFQQAYCAEVQKVLEPVFARLGVKHEARNFGNGGLGTLHNGVGAGSIYGPDVSFLLWDSSMTEKSDLAAQAIFARQGILGGIKVPVIWGLVPKVLQQLHRSDVDTGCFGNAQSGLKDVENFEMQKTLPFATRYMKCSHDNQELCKPFKFMGTCWINRTDYTPEREQKGSLPGRARWHPGVHSHRLQGRTMAFVILTALHEVLTTWSEADGQVLPEETWHVTSYYENTREKIRTVNLEDSHCQKFRNSELDFICKYPFKARTEFTPRAYASFTNIRTLMPPEMLENINAAQKSEYSPPDVFNWRLYPPDGEIDVVNVLESGPEFKAVMAPSYLDFYDSTTAVTPSSIPPGKGVQLSTQANDDECDGLIDSFCNRGSNNNCLLNGHHDARGGIRFDSFSGWVKLNIPRLKFGYVVLKIETWHRSGTVEKTANWTSINNERRLEPFCDDLRFEYAIDGNISSVGKKEFDNMHEQVQRVVNLVPILKDPDFTGGQERDVEVAIRITGCNRHNVFSLTHIYWA